MSTPKTEMYPVEYIIHRRSSEIQGVFLDLKQRCKIPSLMLLLQEAALEQILKIGLSARELGPRGLGWVLNQIDVRFENRPRIGDRVTVTTGPTGKDRLFTYRDYRMEDQLGNKVLEASSKWIIFDIKNRKLATYPEDIEEYLNLSNDFDKLERPARLRGTIERVDYYNIRTVRYHDLDFNGHMSNNIYFQWLLDALPDEYLRDRDIVRLNVTFKAEAVYGDQVRVEIQQVDENNFFHHIRKGEQILTFAHSSWR